MREGGGGTLFFEEVDAVNYGLALVRQPVEGVGPKHVLLGYGTKDS